MNKMIKLPLFLGICGAACAGILAGINSFTAPVIEQAKIDKANAAYISMYSSFGVTSEHITVEDADLYEAGCTTKAIIVNDNVKGIAYTCSAKGYAGTISFQVAFANGQYLAYTDLGHGETDGFGKDVIDNFTNLIKGISSDTKLMDNSSYTSAIAGKSITGKALAKAIEVCRADYATWYAAQ